MLKKRERLSRSDFKTLLQKGCRVHSAHYTVIYTQHTPTLKCGLVVGKKIAKKATKRNKLRRKIYSILGENKHVLQHSHVAVLTKPAIVHLSTKELKKSLTETLQTLNGKTGPSTVE